MTLYSLLTEPILSVLPTSLFVAVLAAMACALVATGLEHVATIWRRGQALERARVG